MILHPTLDLRDMRQRLLDRVTDYEARHDLLVLLEEVRNQAARIRELEAENAALSAHSKGALA